MLFVVAILCLFHADMYYHSLGAYTWGAKFHPSCKSVVRKLKPCATVQFLTRTEQLALYCLIYESRASGLFFVAVFCCWFCFVFHRGGESYSVFSCS